MCYFPRGEGGAPDYAGRPLDYSPKLTVNIGYAYTLPLTDDASLTASVRTRLSDAYMMTHFATPRQIIQPSYTKTDLNLTYSAAGSAGTSNAILRASRIRSWSTRSACQAASSPSRPAIRAPMACEPAFVSDGSLSAGEP